MIKIKVRRITMEIEKSNVNIKLTLVIKYIAMAVIIGIIVGIVDTIFGK